MDFAQLDLQLPNLAELHEGETLYSWCGRIHQWNGNATGVRTSEQLFGSRRAGFFHDFPSHLDALVARTGSALSNAGNIALRHTLLGYYAPFLVEKRAEEVIKGVQHGTVDRLKFHLALPKSGVGADHPLKGCFECFKHDAEAGETPY